MTIDDLHWADSASLRWLVYLAPRLEEIAVLVLAGAQSGELSTEPVVLEAFGRAVTLRPLLLSESAVGQLLSGSLADDVHPEFVRACREATGGNPFLLGELIGAGAALFAGASAAETIALARSALAGGQLLDEETADSLALYIPCLSVLWSDDIEGAARVFSDAIDQAHSRGSLRGFAMAASLRAGAEIRRGALAEAETDARAMLHATRETGLHLGTPIAGTVLIDVLIVHGGIEALTPS